jgi:putative tricarboxylic transport membrane protein
VWAVIASLYVGNVLLLVLNLPLVGIWVHLLRIPYSILFPLILAFTAVGSYTTRSSLFDVGVLIVFGIIGYVCKKIGFPVAPMAFTLILGPLTEKALRQSLSMSGGDLSVLVRGPLSTGLMIVAALVLAFPLFRWMWRRLTGRKAIAIPLADN